jgi:hypothetical protein
MIQKVLTGTASEKGFNIAANVCCGDAVQAPRCFYKLTEQSTANFANFTGIAIEGQDVLFSSPIVKTDATALTDAIVSALGSKNYNVTGEYAPISVKIEAGKVTIRTDKMEAGDFYLLTDGTTPNNRFVFSVVCPNLDANPWSGNPTERVGVGSQEFTGDGSVVTLTPPSKANLAEINFLGGDGKYTLDGSNPTTSATAQEGLDDVQFEVEEKTGLNAIKLTAPAGVTILVMYYYRPAGFNA